MRKTADAVTQCKFESTDPASDDTVLYKILQVINPSLRSTYQDHLLVTTWNKIKIACTYHARHCCW